MGFDMKKTVLVLIVMLLLMGCASTPQEVTVTYEPDAFGVPVPVINGESYPLTDSERLAIGQAFVNAYCPAHAR